MAGQPDPGTAREEAERLVASAIGAVSLVARRIGRTSRGPVSSSPLGEALPPGFGPLADALVDSARSAFGLGQPEYRVANGSPECCVCPVCRAIAAMRDPSPQAAERLATGAGDLAAGVASFLRAVAGAGAGAGGAGRAAPAEDRPGPGGPDPGAPGETWPAPDEPVASGALGDVWQAATRGATAPGTARDAPATEPRPAAAVPGSAPPAVPGSEPPAVPGSEPPAAPQRKPMAKKAVRPAARPAEAAPATPERKPMAKKAVKPAARPADAPADRGDEGR
jgi:hypothetical protein